MTMSWRVAMLMWVLAIPVQSWAESALPWVFHAGATATGNGAALTADYYSTIGVQIEGTFDATVTFEKKTAGASAYVAVQCRNATDGTQDSVATDPGYWECPGAAASFRVRVSVYTSGTVIVTGHATTAVASRGSGGGVSGWPTVSTTKEVTWANAFATALCVGGGVNPLCIYEDATLGGVIRPKTLGNVQTYIWTGFTWCLFSIGNDRCMLIVTPSATDNDKYVWNAGERPVKTLSLPADALYPRGSSTLVTDTALVSGGLIAPYLTTTDVDADGFYRYLVMDPKWDGGTVTATVHIVNTNATPANAFRVDVSGECFPAGTLVQPTISTTGEQSAIITFGSSGSCGVSACNQNDPASATTAAITINGTPAGGNYCGFQAQTNASGTTETVGGIKIVQLDINYKISKGF